MANEFTRTLHILLGNSIPLRDNEKLNSYEHFKKLNAQIILSSLRVYFEKES
jgi:hypothetical protein